jgi:hypothetical protein
LAALRLRLLPSGTPKHSRPSPYLPYHRLRTSTMAVGIKVHIF